MTSDLIRSIARNALGLGLFAIVTAGLIAIVQDLTADDILAQQQRAQAGALLEIIPEHRHDNDLLSDRFTVEATASLGLKKNGTGYRARQDGQVMGVILPVVALDGYSGAIRLIVGIDRNGSLLGVRVLEHKETPGLGDQIEARKSDWLQQFPGKSLANPGPEEWQVEKRGGQFDQFTGATVTPNAIVTSVASALGYFKTQRSRLLGDQPTIPAAPARNGGEAVDAR